MLVACQGSGGVPNRPVAEIVQLRRATSQNWTQVANSEAVASSRISPHSKTCLIGSDRSSRESSRLSGRRHATPATSTPNQPQRNTSAMPPTNSSRVGGGDHNTALSLGRVEYLKTRPTRSASTNCLFSDTHTCATPSGCVARSRRADRSARLELTYVTDESARSVAAQPPVQPPSTRDIRLSRDSTSGRVMSTVRTDD